MYDCEVVIVKLSVMLANEVKRSKGGMVIKEVPYSKQPTQKALRRIEREIAAEISANEAMSSRSMHYASKMSIK